MQPKHIFRIGPALLSLVLFAAGSTLAVSQVARQHNFMEFHLGTGSPVGSYDKVGTSIELVDVNGFPVKFDADELYDNALHLGFAVGAIQRNLLLSLAFQYTDINFEDSFKRLLREDDPFFPIPSLSQFDLTLNLNGYAAQLPASSISPFVGLGFAAGMTVDRTDGFDTESRLTAALKANFGVEFKVAEFRNGGFMTLASSNSYDLLATENRPRFLTIGGFLRLYVRP